MAERLAAGDGSEAPVASVHVTKGAPDIKTQVTGMIDKGKILVKA
jgi:hypothetical protein